MKIIKCPICKTKILPIGMKNHILNKAEGETYTRMKLLFYHNKKNFNSVSRTVLLRNMPHFAFVRRNTKQEQKGKFNLPL